MASALLNAVLWLTSGGTRTTDGESRLSRDTSELPIWIRRPRSWGTKDSKGSGQGYPSWRDVLLLATCCCSPAGAGNRESPRD